MAGAVASDSQGAAPDISKWQSIFEAVLRQILAEYEGTEEKVRDGMEAGMRKLFEKPYIAELHAMRGLDGPAPSKEEAQRILFLPKLSDMNYYVKAFARVTPEATARLERICKFKLMSVFYTLHRKDGALMDRFMHLGGLESLAILLGEEHNVIQSQAVELLIELLCPLMSLDAASSSRQAHLHHEVYQCLRCRAFWQNIARIVGEPHELFPKSHANCIRLLAGAIGWLRPQEDGAKPESGSLLGTEEVEEALDGLLKSNGSALSADPETRGLAHDVLMEFKDSLVVRGDPLKGAELEAAQKALFGPDSARREDAAHAWQSLRKLGNDAIKGGLVWPAEAAYRAALEEGANVVPSSEASLIESNRALALLKGGHHLEAAAAAERALEADPRNVKAAYRRAQALLELPGAGAREVRAAEEAAALAASLEPKDAKVAEMLQRAQEKVKELPAEPEQVGYAAPEAAEAPCAAAEEPAAEALDSMD
jgi:tetratricopeptide (TPR) repeat protein